MKQQCQTIKITSPSDSDGLPALVQIKLLTQSEGPCKITPKQNRPSLEQTPEADNAGSFHFQRSWSFTTMFPPDSMPSACSRTCSLNRRIGYSCSPGFGDSIFSKIPTGSPWLWPMPAMRTSSSSPQAQTTGLTISVEDWIKSCLQRKRGSSAAVVALLGPEPDMDGQDSPRLQFLEGVARKAGLDFFAPKSRCRHQFLDDHQIAGKNRKADSPKRKGHIGYKGIRPGNVLASCCISTMIWLSAAQAQAQTAPTNSASDEVLAWRSANTNIWENGVGEGFKRGVQSVSFDAGAGYGIKVFGGKQSHDLALQSISYGCTLGPVEGDGHWYRGNWEFRGELFSGAQFVPTSDWLVGLTPHLRYNFMTGTRWIPFVDAGAGVSATGIGAPDLSHYFEFNLQAATGVRWFIRDNVALSIEARYLHMSCAGISSPNLGLNNVNGMVGISWFF